MENVTKYFTFIIEFHRDALNEKFDEINEWRFHKRSALITLLLQTDQSWKRKVDQTYSSCAVTNNCKVFDMFYAQINIF